MKIEKVNDHQFRCTLTKKELEKRDLKLSEVAYGNEKLKGLFSEMMRKASDELGFEAENVPLMIEVIPFQDHVVVVVTKVDEPEELDTRFSHFAPSIVGEDGTSLSELFENLLDLNDDNKPGFFAKLAEMAKKNAELVKQQEEQDQEEDADEEEDFTPISCYYSFDSLKDVLTVASNVDHGITEPNSLYKDPRKNTYVLEVTCNALDDQEFYRLCHIAGEYGQPIKNNGYYKFFVNEHFETIITGNALQSLINI